MSRRILVLALLSSLSVLAAGAQAEARPPLHSLLPIDLLDAQAGAPVPDRPPFGTGFSLDPPGPYEVRVSTAGAAVVVAVKREKPKRWIALTRYLARGVAAPERLQATFGNLGTVSMRFRESRHRPWLGKKRRCRGDDRFVVRRGVFVGNFRFRGEGGYLAIRAHRAKGSITTVAAKCRKRDDRRRARSSAAVEESFSGLIASDRKGVNSTVFGALSLRGELGYLAQREENRGRLSVLRFAAMLSEGEFPLNEAATAGRFSPGIPFHGSGRYRAAPDGSTSWSGNLAVDFPGAGRFPLARPTYATLLEAGF
jgi:hypothetical protein